MHWRSPGLKRIAAAWPARQWAAFSLGGVSARSLWALAFLVVCGSILGLTSYIWLLRVTTAARVATYAYVNPVVAVALGDEREGARVPVASNHDSKSLLFSSARKADHWAIWPDLAQLALVAGPGPGAPAR